MLYQINKKPLSLCSPGTTGYDRCRGRADRRIFFPSAPSCHSSPRHQRPLRAARAPTRLCLDLLPPGCAGPRPCRPAPALGRLPSPAGTELLPLRADRRHPPLPAGSAARAGSGSIAPRRAALVARRRPRGRAGAAGAPAEPAVLRNAGASRRRAPAPTWGCDLRGAGLF